MSDRSMYTYDWNVFFAGLRDFKTTLVLEYASSTRMYPLNESRRQWIFILAMVTLKNAYGSL